VTSWPPSRNGASPRLRQASCHDGGLGTLGDEADRRSGAEDANVKHERGAWRSDHECCQHAIVTIDDRRPARFC
jgi:hypothetical protein